MPEVGFVLATTADDWDHPRNPYIKAFKRKIGSAANVTVLPPKGAKAKPVVIRQAAQYMVDNEFDVIVTAGTASALICIDVTKTNKYPPVVFASVGDPPLSGLDQPQPGRWYTGGSNGQVTHVKKRVDYMLGKPIFKPPYAVVGYYKNPTNDPATAAMKDAYDYLVTKVGAANVVWGKIQNNESMSEFIARLSPAPKSLYCCSDLVLTEKAIDLNDAADAAGMATMWEFDEHRTIHHGKDAKGVSIKDLFEHAAEQVLDILNGSAPDTLPIYAPDLATLRRARRKRRSVRGRKKR